MAEVEVEAAGRGVRTWRRLPRRRGVGEALGQGSGGPGRAGRQAEGREPDSEYQARIEAEANRLIKRVVATGEFYLVRAGNTRKGTGTFYTRPQLAVPTVHRTLEPLCYDKAEDGTLTPKTPEAILGPEGLRPGVRQCLVPGGRPALPDRRPVQVALPPPAPGRPERGQADHAALRPASHGQGETRNSCRSRPTTRSGATRSPTGSRPCCGGTSSSGASTAWTSTRWPWSWPVCRSGSRRSTPNCRSRSSTTRSRSATRWSAAGWTGWRTTRSRPGSGRAATARTAPAPADRDIPQGREGRQPARRATGGSSRRCGRSSRAGSRAGQHVCSRTTRPRPSRSSTDARTEYETLHELPDRRPGRAGAVLPGAHRASSPSLRG